MEHIQTSHDEYGKQYYSMPNYGLYDTP